MKILSEQEKYFAVKNKNREKRKKFVKEVLKSIPFLIFGTILIFLFYWLMTASFWVIEDHSYIQRLKGL